MLYRLKEKLPRVATSSTIRTSYPTPPHPTPHPYNLRWDRLTKRGLFGTKYVSFNGRHVPTGTCTVEKFICHTEITLRFFSSLTSLSQLRGSSLLMELGQVFFFLFSFFI